MKNKIKNTFKKAGVATIAFTAGLIVFIGAFSVYAAWDASKNAGDPIDSADWNDIAHQVQSWTRNGENVSLGTTGNLGIGTDTPNAKLEVNGNIIAAEPTAANHIATKAYVDASGGGADDLYNKTCPADHAFAGYNSDGSINCIDIVAIVEQHGSGGGSKFIYRENNVEDGVITLDCGAGWQIYKTGYFYCSRSWTYSNCNYSNCAPDWYSLAISGYYGNSGTTSCNGMFSIGWGYTMSYTGQQSFSTTDERKGYYVECRQGIEPIDML